MSGSKTLAGRDVLTRWPRLRPFLRVDAAGAIDGNLLWYCTIADTLNPSERAAGYEEWAEFYEHQLVLRADELANDPHKRKLVEQWTDTMVYCCRRLAATARGENPGEWIPEHQRRPGLDQLGPRSGTDAPGQSRIDGS